MIQKKNLSRKKTKTGPPCCNLKSTEFFDPEKPINQDKRRTINGRKSPKGRL